MDGCLSVIAQAFMDSFSLSEMQLGKVSTAPILSLITIAKQKGGFYFVMEKAVTHLQFII